MRGDVLIPQFTKTGPSPAAQTVDKVVDFSTSMMSTGGALGEDELMFKIQQDSL